MFEALHPVQTFRPLPSPRRTSWPLLSPGRASGTLPSLEQTSAALLSPEAAWRFTLRHALYTAALEVTGVPEKSQAYSGVAV